MRNDIELLENTLKYLKPYLDMQDIYEIRILEPGKVYLQCLDGKSRMIEDKKLDAQRLEFLAVCLATYSGNKFSEEFPSLATTLPGFEARAHILRDGYATNITYVIRLNRSRKPNLNTFFKNKDKKEEFLSLLKNRKNFLVAGSTSSGKTSFLKAAFDHVPSEENIVVIEDTRELNFDHERMINIVVSRSGSNLSKTTENNAVNDARRLNPDRIVLGEISIGNAAPFLSALNAGDAGCATIHANSAKDALMAIAQNVSLAGGSHEKALFLAKRYIPAVVYLNRVSDEFNATLTHFEESYA